MIFDVCGLPKVNGADDWADSSHLAGLLAVMHHPEAVLCLNYLAGREYVRHPAEQRYDFSRDQATMLMCGLIAQAFTLVVDLSYIKGKDILPPSVRGIERIARTGKAFWYQKLWLKGEIYWHAYLQPLEEPFQIIAMCRVYGPEYLKLWTSKNKLWKWSIRRYLSQLDGAWRNEPELAEWVIAKVEHYVENASF